MSKDTIFADETEAPSANEGASASPSKPRKTKGAYTAPEVPHKCVPVVDVLAHYEDSGMSAVSLAEAVLLLDQGRRAHWTLRVRDGFSGGPGLKVDQGTLRLVGRDKPPEPKPRTRYRFLDAPAAFSLAESLERRFVFTPEGTEDKVNLFRARWADLPSFSRFCRRAFESYAKLVGEKEGDEAKVTESDLQRLVQALAGVVDQIEPDTLDQSAAEALGL